MPGLERIDPVAFLLPGRLVSLVGGGGKTSLAEYLAGRIAKEGKRAVITTTTRILAEEPYVLLDEGPIEENAWTSPFLRVGRSVEAGKLTDLSEGDIESIGRLCDFVLVEADGAKRLPLKYPAAYEPVIPRLSSIVIVLAGLDGLGGTIEEKVFRWRLFCEATGLPPSSEVTASVFLRLFDADGLMKGVEPSRSVVILNKYDECECPQAVPELAKSLAKRTGVRRVIVASVRLGEFYVPACKHDKTVLIS